MVVNPAPRHLFEGLDECIAGLFVVTIHGHLKQEVQSRRMRKLGL